MTVTLQLFSLDWKVLRATIGGRDGVVGTGPPGSARKSVKREGKTSRQASVSRLDPRE